MIITRRQLNKISFLVKKNVDFEAWHASDYGPLKQLFSYFTFTLLPENNSDKLFNSLLFEQHFVTFIDKLLSLCSLNIDDEIEIPSLPLLELENLTKYTCREVMNRSILLKYAPI